MAVRSSTICDGYVCNTLLPACRTQLIEKVMIVVPGLNSLPGILHLTATSLHHNVLYPGRTQQLLGREVRVEVDRRRAPE